VKIDFKSPAVGLWRRAVAWSATRVLCLVCVMGGLASAAEPVRQNIPLQSPMLDNQIISVDLTQVVQVLPPFYTNPPPVLQMGNYTLNVVSWQSRSWDSTKQQIIGANGLAWFRFGCMPSPRPLFPGELLTNRVFAVVQTVQQPDREISLADARKIDSLAKIGSQAVLSIPVSALNASAISNATGIILNNPPYPRGSVFVQFTNLTIAATADSDTGQVLGGSALFPVPPGSGAPIVLPENNFTLYLSSLNLTVQGASASGYLELPPSIIDPGTGHPGQISLTNFEISSQCAFHLELPNQAYGPWGIGNTEVQVQGSGVEADFDSTWTAPLVPAGTPAANLAWEGVVLGSGSTVAPLATNEVPVISNSGYVRGSYSYPWAEVSADGFEAQLTLTKPFVFETVEPLGYLVHLGGGAIELTNSAISSGMFNAAQVEAPLESVTYDTGADPLIVGIQTLTLASNLDLYGPAQMQSTSKDIFWGDSTTNRLVGANIGYRAGGFAQGLFGISGTNQSNFFPLNAQDQLTLPAYSPNPLVSGLQGLTLYGPSNLDVLTIDTPNATRLQFVPEEALGKEKIWQDEQTWLNIVFDGVHGNFTNFVSQPGSSLELGHTNQSYYAGVTPFEAGSGHAKDEPSYTLSVSFVASAVWHAGMSGTVALPEPVKASLDFSQMGFTSTAQITAGQVPLNQPLKLDYWGMEVARRNGAQAGAVMDVHTGQIFFTAAGLWEPRHFAEPFYLLWGKLLANGSLGELDFDCDSAGQQFDGFSYVPAFVALSDYVPAAPAWMKTAGNVSFDFFGAKYVNVNDTNAPSLTNAPYNGRDVALADDSNPGEYQGTDHTLAGSWSQGLANFNFTNGYDSAAQDGFTGVGTVEFPWISDPLTATVVMKADPEFCICISDSGNHNMRLGPQANFAVLGQITGCGCFLNGQLQEIMLSAQLDAEAANANVCFSSTCCAGVQVTLTPTFAQVQFQGDMFLTVDSGSSSRLEVVGAAAFTVDWAQAYVEGNVSGHFDTSSMLGGQSLSADGQLDWHIAAPVSAQSYQELQGKLSVNVVYPVGQAGVEGGFYLGINAPTSEAWVLNSGMDSRFGLNTAALPATLTGVYGYVKVSNSINLWVVSGGYDAYVGLGGFWLPAISTGPLNAVAPGAGLGVPYVIGNVGYEVWGEILGGLVSADGWTDLQVIAPYPFSFQGTVGLHACAAWLVCGTADVSVGLNSVQGFYVN